MSYMDQGTKATIKPPILCVVGFPGAGKTSLASLFPSPAFIQAEDSKTVFEDIPEDLQPHFNPILPKASKQKNISTKKVLLDQLREFATADHPYKTLIIDSVSALNDMLENEVIEFLPGKTQSIQDAAGGFQKAHELIAKWHQEIISACNVVRDKRGMGIVFLTHSTKKKVKNHAEISGDFTVYGMRIHDLSEDVYLSLCDSIIYLKQLQSTSGYKTDDKGRTIKRGRVKMSSTRVLITSSDGVEGFVSAKSRYDMPNEIDVPKGTNPILQYIPFYREYVAANGLAVEQEQEEVNINDDKDQVNE